MKKLYVFSINVRKFVKVSEVQKYKNFSELKKKSPINTKKNNDIASDSRSEDDVMNRLFPYHPEATNFTIVCRRSDYSAGRIVHAIEDCNANVLNLNVTANDYSDDFMRIDVRVDRTDISSIIRSLDRYGMTVESHYGDREISDEDRFRVAQLLRFIDI